MTDYTESRTKFPPISNHNTASHEHLGSTWFQTHVSQFRNSSEQSAMMMQETHKMRRVTRSKIDSLQSKINFLKRKEQSMKRSYKIHRHSEKRLSSQLAEFCNFKLETSQKR